MNSRGTSSFRVLLVSAQLVGCTADSGEAISSRTNDGGGGSGESLSSGGENTGGSGGSAMVYPAFSITLPEITKSPGPIIESPSFIAILFEGDPLLDDIQSFVSNLPQSNYFTTITSEYGVSSPSARTIVLGESAPSIIDDSEVASWIAAHESDAEWALEDTNSVFVIFYPEGSEVTQMGGTACVDFYGYHAEGTTDTGLKFPYAVIPRCSATGFQDLDVLTVTASHEMLESVTSPFVFTDPAYQWPDDAHASWTFFPGSELADMCAQNGDAFVRPDELGFMVQRSWSNLEASLQRDPCLPTLGSAYFNATPVADDEVEIPGWLTTRGLKLSVGESTTIDVELWSTEATDGLFSVEALDLTSTFFGTERSFALSLDRTEGSNGDVLKLSIDFERLGPQGGLQGIVLRTALLSDPAQVHYWTTWVGP